VKAQFEPGGGKRRHPRARAVGFLMALYQRRLASSTYSLRRSLENRGKRLTEMLKEAQEIARTLHPTLPDMEELDEMEDSERERLEDMIAAVNLARNPDQVKEEVEELKGLVRARDPCRECRMRGETFPPPRTLKQQALRQSAATASYLHLSSRTRSTISSRKLKEWNFTVGTIHGGMHIGSRDETGTRLHAEQQFREGGLRYLSRPKQPGKGINLQCCKHPVQL